MRFGLNCLSLLIVLFTFVNSIWSESQESDNNRELQLRSIENRRDGIHRMIRTLNRLDRSLADIQYENMISKRDFCPGMPGGECDPSHLQNHPTLSPKNPGKRESLPDLESFDSQPAIKVQSDDGCLTNLPGDCEDFGDHIDLPDRNPGKRSINCKLFGIGCDPSKQT